MFSKTRNENKHQAQGRISCLFLYKLPDFWEPQSCGKVLLVIETFENITLCQVQEWPRGTHKKALAGRGLFLSSLSTLAFLSLHPGFPLYHLLHQDARARRCLRRLPGSLPARESRWPERPVSPTWTPYIRCSDIVPFNLPRAHIRLRSPGAGDLLSERTFDGNCSGHRDVQGHTQGHQDVQGRTHTEQEARALPPSLVHCLPLDYLSPRLCWVIAWSNWVFLLPSGFSEIFFCTNIPISYLSKPVSPSVSFGKWKSAVQMKYGSWYIYVCTFPWAFI